jgi:acid phosphatase (class A)
MFDRTLRLSLTLAAAAALLATGAAGHAADAPAPAPAPAAALAAKPVKTLMVLTPYDIDPSRLLPPPAADGSDAQKAELADLHRIADTVTPERMAQAKWDDDHEDTSLFYETIGGGFDLKALPATAALMAIVANDTSIGSGAAKKLFARKRPWAVDPTLHTCDPGDKPLTSYPSGHSVVGYSQAFVLAALIPEKAQALQARAADYAFSREVCGSHYRSDTEASHALSAALATLLLANPALKPKIEAARAELRAAHFTAR